MNQLGNDRNLRYRTRTTTKLSKNRPFYPKGLTKALTLRMTKITLEETKRNLLNKLRGDAALLKKIAPPSFISATHRWALPRGKPTRIVLSRRLHGAIAIQDSRAFEVMLKAPAVRE